jgi:hypothetical protein
VSDDERSPALPARRRPAVLPAVPDLRRRPAAVAKYSATPAGLLAELEAEQERRRG